MTADRTIESSRSWADECLYRRYPIASGVFEGAFRHLIADWMDRSRAGWTLEGARSMLNIRAAIQCDHWRTFLDWNSQAEITQTHKHAICLEIKRPYLSPAKMQIAGYTRREKPVESWGKAIVMLVGQITDTRLVDFLKTWGF